ncbi:uncharacterized protein LOC125072788 [Vanessa atalanta]|uniref:uncharacterized protein LOC125072788 n=1 Tax=Vanessa atalanta TaxID=42275 RepID=UPI001FCD7C7F|nr:uncharacterized protein LOC125072788 [Vanessa atalanta]
MSLLQKISYKEYKYASTLSIEKCEIIAKLADLKVPFNDSKKPGELLIKYLDRCGCSLQQYKSLINSALNTKTIITYYHPLSKVAILIANEKYEHLSKLATPSVDCDSLACNLRNLGFITITIKNTKISDLKDMIAKIILTVPEDSYCFIFYAGHGCELCNTKCILGIDCPTENIKFSHCITENWLLREVAKCKPETCILIMDMCRINLDRYTNSSIYASMSDLEDYTIHNNLFISYSTQSSQAAYEVLQIECTTTIDNDVTYELKTGDTEKIVPGASQYVNALCTRLVDNFDISTLLDKVHGDVENSIKKQRPIKVQCGVNKRSLYDPVKGDTKELLIRLRDILQNYKENCSVF